MKTLTELQTIPLIFHSLKSLCGEINFGVDKVAFGVKCESADLSLHPWQQMFSYAEGLNLIQSRNQLDYNNSIEVQEMNNYKRIELLIP